MIWWNWPTLTKSCLQAHLNLCIRDSCSHMPSLWVPRPRTLSVLFRFQGRVLQWKKLSGTDSRSLGFSSASSPWMTQDSSIPSWHFSFLCYRMSSEPNDTRSKILKCRCPRFALLQSFQRKCRFGSHPKWFTDVLSKNILLNIWSGTGILFRACKSALIVPWQGHANFHLCLGHCSYLSSSTWFPNLFILLFSILHKTTTDLDMLPIFSCWCPKLDGVFEEPLSIAYLFIQRKRGGPQSTLGTSNTHELYTLCLNIWPGLLWTQQS